MHISGISFCSLSKKNIRNKLAISRYISAKSLPYLRHIIEISPAYYDNVMNFSGISKAALEYISGVSHVFFRNISGIF